MAATWVSNTGCGMMLAWCQMISMSWRAAWNTFSTPSLAISSKNGLRSMPSARVSMTIASSALAICTTHSSG
ncbi:hypothetical protein ACVWW3_001934 [Bradyrhizobium sp. LM2.9]